MLSLLGYCFGELQIQTPHVQEKEFGVSGQAAVWSRQSAALDCLLQAAAKCSCATYKK